MQDTDLVEVDGQGKGQGGSVVSTGRVGAGGGPVGGAGIADGLISGCLALCLFVAGNQVMCSVDCLQCGAVQCSAI